MGLRANLQDILGNCLPVAAKDNVYFQPPESIKMKYPCIVYELNDIDILYADNGSYAMGNQYSVTVIDRNPDSDIPGKVAKLPTAGFDRFFTSDNLNHYVFRLYY